jgi:hypothetical protein
MIYGWFNITIEPLDEEVESPDMAVEHGTA